MRHPCDPPHEPPLCGCEPIGAAPTMPLMPRGRPPQDDVTRDRMLRVRVTADQEARYRAAAEAEGLDLSTWLRDLADEHAASVLRRAL